MKNYSTDSIRVNNEPPGKGIFLPVMILLMVLVSVIQVFFFFHYYFDMLSWVPISGYIGYAIGLYIRVIVDACLPVLAGGIILYYFKNSPYFPVGYSLWVGILFISILLSDTFFFLDRQIIPRLGYPSFFYSKLAFFLMALTVPYLFSSERVKKVFL